MKKLVLLLLAGATTFGMLSCGPKTYLSEQMATNVNGVNPADFMPFTKSLKYRLDQDKADIRKIQFYIDKPLVLRYTATSSGGGSAIKGGTVMYDNAQDVTELTIPAYTPGVCERVVGDSLLISFDAPNNYFVFAALYANEDFFLQGTNWYNGVCDVNYDGKIYKAQCDGCGSAGEAMLMIKRSQSGPRSMKPAGSNAHAIAGRKLK